MEWTQETVGMKKKVIPPGRVIAISGDSGSGKTRFMEAIYSKYGQTYDMVLMKQDVIMYPSMTVLETLCFYCPHLKKQEIELYLVKMRLEHLKDAVVGSFDDQKISGGEKKRIFLCYMLLDPSRVILCDEPFSGLDELNINLFFEAMLESKKTVVFSFHHLLPGITSRVDELWEMGQEGIRYYENAFTEIPLREEVLHVEPEPLKRKKMLWRELLIIRKDPVNHLAKYLTPVVTIMIQDLILGSVSDYYRIWKKTENDFYFYDLILVYICNLFSCSIASLGSFTNHQKKHYIIHHEIQQGIYDQKQYAFTVLYIDTILFFISCLTFSVISCGFFRLLWVYLFNTFVVTMFSDYVLWFLTFRFPRSPMLVMFLLIIYISFSFVINFGFLLYYKTAVARYIQYFSIIHQQTNIFMESLSQNRIARDSLALLNLDGRLDSAWWYLISGASLAFFPLLTLLF